MPGFRIVIKGFFLLAAVLVALVGLINAFDEDLKPEIESFAQYEKISVPDDQNAYFYQMGMAASKGADPMQLGQKIIARAFELDVQRGLATEPILFTAEHEVLGKNKIEVTGNLYSLCQPRKTPCLDAYEKSRSKIRNLINDNRLLFQRSKKLRTFPHYSERKGTDLDFPLPGYSIVVQQLTLADAALLANSGKLFNALVVLEEEAHFWRIVSRESHTIIGKILGLIYFDNVASLAAQIDSRYALTVDQKNKVDNILSPLTPAELSLSRSIRYEYFWNADLIRNTLNQMWLKSGEQENYNAGLFTRLLQATVYQENATINDIYDRFLLIEKVSRYSAPEFLAHLKTDAVKVEHDLTEVGFHYIYNPFGKTINSIAGNHIGMMAYIARAHNTDAKIRLLSVKRQLRKNKIRSSGTKRFLDNLPSKLRNPYTNEPPTWNQKKGIIYYKVVNNKRELLESDPLSGTVSINL